MWQPRLCGCRFVMIQVAVFVDLAPVRYIVDFRRPAKCLDVRVDPEGAARAGVLLHFGEYRHPVGDDLFCGAAG